MAYRLKVIQGPGVGSELELDDGDSTIGRAPENALVINDNNVSRVHARFRSKGNRVSVMDAGSRNGVYVNDRRLEGEEMQAIGPGDRVVIGQSILELLSDNGAAAGRPRAAAVAVRPPAAAAGRPAAPQPRTATGAVVRSGGAGPMARAPVSGPKVVSRKPSQSALPKPILFGILGAGMFFVVVVIAMSGGGAGGGDAGKGPGGGPTRGPGLPPTPGGLPALPPLAGIGQGGSEDKCSPECQRSLDLGDSQRDGGNYKAARDSFQRAVDLEPSCVSCVVRLESVERTIEDRIKFYEKSGILYFEKGDYLRAMEAWKVAIEFMPDVRKQRDPTKKLQWETRRKELEKKVRDADKLVERQPQ